MRYYYRIDSSGTRTTPIEIPFGADVHFVDDALSAAELRMIVNDLKIQLDAEKTERVKKEKRQKWIDLFIAMFSALFAWWLSNLG